MPHDASADTENVLFNEMPGQIALEVEEGFTARWDRIHELRDTDKKALEPVIKDKVVKTSLETCVTLQASGEELSFINEVLPELKAVFIVSAVRVREGDGEMTVEVSKAEGEKCDRCWAYSPTVGECAEHPTLCARCAAILSE
jgi:isoleucyl-tRNA synthetase